MSSVERFFDAVSRNATLQAALAAAADPDAFIAVAQKHGLTITVDELSAAVGAGNTFREEALATDYLVATPCRCLACGSGTLREEALATDYLVATPCRCLACGPAKSKHH
jgi:predicted ribosomally synthesized peptide with nif11-like leader